MLGTFVNDHGVDYVGARKLVNGNDSADAIRDYAIDIEVALKKSQLK